MVSLETRARWYLSNLCVKANLVKEQLVEKREKAVGGALVAQLYEFYANTYI